MCREASDPYGRFVRRGPFDHADGDRVSLPAPASHPLPYLWVHPRTDGSVSVGYGRVHGPSALRPAPYGGGVAHATRPSVSLSALGVRRFAGDRSGKFRVLSLAIVWTSFLILRKKGRLKCLLHLKRSFFVGRKLFTPPLLRLSQRHCGRWRCPRRPGWCRRRRCRRR